jgi:hypothetical protein
MNNQPCFIHPVLVQQLLKLPITVLVQAFEEEEEEVVVEVNYCHLDHPQRIPLPHYAMEVFV